MLGAEEAIGAQTASATGFVLGEDEQQLLVVGSEIPQMAALRGNEDVAEGGDVVQVTGNVREFDLAALEEDLGSELVENDFTPYSDRPVLVASAVNLIPTTARQQGEQIVLSAERRRADGFPRRLPREATHRQRRLGRRRRGGPVAAGRRAGQRVLILGASGGTNV